jgi:hypothetical protein
MLPPPLTCRGGAPRTILDSSGTLAFGLPFDHIIHQDALFETPLTVLKVKGEVAAAEPEHNDAMIAQQYMLLVWCLRVHLVTKPELMMFSLIPFYTDVNIDLVSKGGNSSKRQQV